MTCFCWHLTVHYDGFVLGFTPMQLSEDMCALALWRKHTVPKFLTFLDSKQPGLLPEYNRASVEAHYRDEFSLHWFPTPSLVHHSRDAWMTPQNLYPYGRAFPYHLYPDRFPYRPDRGWLALADIPMDSIRRGWHVIGGNVIAI